jgi:hypothetical protein
MQGISYRQYLILSYLTKFKRIKLNKKSINCNFLLYNQYIENVPDIDGHDPFGAPITTPTNYYKVTDKGINAFFNYKYNRLPRFLSIISLIISILAFLHSVQIISLKP